MSIPLNKPGFELMIDLINLSNNTKFTPADLTVTEIQPLDNPLYPNYNTTAIARGTGTTTFKGPKPVRFRRLDLEVLTGGRSRHFDFPERETPYTMEEVLVSVNNRFNIQLVAGVDVDDAPVPVGTNAALSLTVLPDSYVYNGGVELTVTTGASEPGLPLEMYFSSDRQTYINRSLKNGYLHIEIVVPADGAADGVDFTITDESEEDPGRFMLHYGPSYVAEQGMLPWERPEWLEWGTHLAGLDMDPEVGGEVPISAGGGFVFRLKDGTPAGTYQIDMPVSYHATTAGMRYSIGVSFIDPSTGDPWPDGLSFDMVDLVPPTVEVTVTPAISNGVDPAHVDIDITVAEPYLPDGAYLLVNINDTEPRAFNITGYPGWTSRTDDPEINRSYVYVEGITDGLNPGTYRVSMDLDINPALGPGDANPIVAFLQSTANFGTMAQGGGQYEIESESGPDWQLYDIGGDSVRVAGKYVFTTGMSRVFHLYDVTSPTPFESVASFPVESDMWSLEYHGGPYGAVALGFDTGQSTRIVATYPLQGMFEDPIQFHRQTVELDGVPSTGLATIFAHPLLDVIFLIWHGTETQAARIYHRSFTGTSDSWMLYKDFGDDVIYGKTRDQTWADAQCLVGSTHMDDQTGTIGVAVRDLDNNGTLYVEIPTIDMQTSSAEFELLPAVITPLFYRDFEHFLYSKIVLEPFENNRLLTDHSAPAPYAYSVGGSDVINGTGIPNGTAASGVPAEIYSGMASGYADYLANNLSTVMLPVPDCTGGTEGGILERAIEVRGFNGITDTGLKVQGGLWRSPLFFPDQKLIYADYAEICNPA